MRDLNFWKNFACASLDAASEDSKQRIWAIINAGTEAMEIADVRKDLTESMTATVLLAISIIETAEEVIQKAKEEHRMKN